MKIVKVPHPSLRTKADPVKRVDAKLVQLIQDLQETLDKKQKPAGVGLAAPQVNKPKRLFATKLPPLNNPEASDKLTVHINPIILDHPDTMVFGPNPKEPTLEGCLSIPKLYGPVPRWEWVKVEYQVLTSNHQLETITETLEWFHARVFQHELDHLNGLLFTDYALQHDLPVYQETKTGKLQEVDKSILEAF